MKSYDIDEIIEICKSQDYGFVCLTDQRGAELIPYNSRNSAFDRLEEIKTRLQSPALKDGVYIVKCKHTNRKNALSDDYLIYKGEKLSEAPQITPQMITHEVLTYDSALKFQVRIKELELEVESLKKQLNDCNSVITELEAELETKATLSEEEEEEEKPSTLETAKEFLSELIAIGAPLIDKHFDLRQQALNLEAQKLLRGGYNQKPRPQQPKQNPQEIAKIQAVENWIKSKESDEDVYNSLIAIYNNSSDLNQFLELLKSNDLNLYNELATI